MTGLSKDLDETITAAVQARVEAAVLQAMSGDEVVGQMVAAAMNEEVEGNNYGREKKTFLQHTIKTAFQKMANNAVTLAVEEEREAVELAVRKEIRKNINALASAQVDELVHKLNYKTELSLMIGTNTRVSHPLQN